MTKVTEPRPNRILVSLDSSSRGRAALQAAVRLAVTMSAELDGLFVEDEDLVRLASLPFATEVDLATASTRDLETIGMERALRAAADEAQQAFASALADAELQWTFRVVRGSVTKASLEAAGDVGLLVIGQQGRLANIMPTKSFGQRVRDDDRVVVVFDGSRAAYGTLEIASTLLEEDTYLLSVLVVATNREQVTQDLIEWLRARGVRAEVDQVLNPSPDAIADYTRRWMPGVLLVNRHSEFLSDVLIGQLVNEFGGPLILS